MATRLALDKAKKVAEHLPDAEFILGADTVVAKDGSILGKPASRDEARKMLEELRDNWHEVFTGIAMIDQRNERTISDSCVSHVPMRKYSDVELEKYLDSGSPMDKAGAYGIQDVNFHPVPVERLKGCYTNVMGLPLCLVVEKLRQWEVEPPFDATHGCTKENVDGCAVYPIIVEQMR
jgi:MAF protein